jgi:beta-N-acetylhexosaminidase
MAARPLSHIRKMPNQKKQIGLIILVIFVISIIAARPGFSETAAIAYKIGAPDEAWANRILKGFSLREKIAQLVQIRVQGKFINRQDPDFQTIKKQVMRTHVGGVVLFTGNVYESAILLNELQNASKLPLLVSADFERGASFRIADTTSFPWAMALGATGSERFAYQQGSITAKEARALGVHWIFAPVVDVNNNPENPVINIRAYGEDPQLVARLGAAFIRGSHDGGVLTTAKHFPGHGDTATDSHLGLAVVESDRARLESIELLPFRRAISAGVDSIMTAHVAVPDVTGSTETPATLSTKILTDLLRNSLQFKGIVVTDALEMGGVANRYWSGLAAVRAIQAGADVLLLPSNVSAAIAEIERAVKRGDILESRIDKSVQKILEAKSRLGLNKTKTVPIGRIAEVVAMPQSSKLAQEIANASITAVKDELHLLPVNPLKDRQIFSLVLASDNDSSPLTVFQAEIRRRFPSVQTLWGDARISDEMFDEIEKAALKSDLILLSTLVRLSSGQAANSIPKKQRAIIEKLLASNKPVVWVSFGNPYVFQAAPSVSAYLCTFSYSDTSQIAAAKAISGEIAIAGRLPVSIPGYFKSGNGLQIPKIDMTLKKALQIKGFEETEKILLSLFENGIIPGAAIILGHEDSIVWERYAGTGGNSTASAGVADQTVYDTSSLARVVATTSAAMLSVASKDLILSSQVGDYWPGPSSIDISELRIQDLLSRYSMSAADSDMLLMNEIVSRASGSSLDQFLAVRLFKPLGMKNTFSNPPQKLLGRIAPSSAGAQLFSSARDMAVFAQMLLNGGIYDHRRYFDRSVLAQFTGNRFSSKESKALGWSKPSATNWTRGLFSELAFGHNAPSGSALWIDPEKQLFVVFLTNAPDLEKAAEAQKTIIESLVRIVAP